MTHTKKIWKKQCVGVPPLSDFFQAWRDAFGFPAIPFHKSWIRHCTHTHTYIRTRKHAHIHVRTNIHANTHTMTHTHFAYISGRSRQWRNVICHDSSQHAVELESSQSHFTCDTSQVRVISHVTRVKSSIESKAATRVQTKLNWTNLSQWLDLLQHWDLRQYTEMCFYYISIIFFCGVQIHQVKHTLKFKITRDIEIWTYCLLHTMFTSSIHIINNQLHTNKTWHSITSVKNMKSSFSSRR